MAKGKKKIFLVIPVIIGAVAAVGFILTNKDKNEEEEAPPFPVEYSIGEDKVSSVTCVVPEEEMLDTFIIGDGNEVLYLYKRSEISEASIESYEEYLKENGFLALIKDEPINSEETNKDVSLEKPNNDENTSKALDANTNEDNIEDTNNNDQAKEDNKEEEINIPEKLKYGIKSKVENKYFEVDVEFGKATYKVTTSLKEGELPIPKKPEKKTPQQALTRETAIEAFKGYNEKYIKLPMPVDYYTYVFDVGQWEINGETCYGINIYEKDENNCNEIYEKYFISLKEQNIYKYDLVQGVCNKIK